MTKAKELKEKNQEELVKMLKEKQNRLLEIRFEKNVRKVKDSTEAKKIKKEIARILTVLNK